MIGIVIQVILQICQQTRVLLVYFHRKAFNTFPQRKLWAYLLGNDLNFRVRYLHGDVPFMFIGLNTLLNVHVFLMPKSIPAMDVSE